MNTVEILFGRLEELRGIPVNREENLARILKTLGTIQQELGQRYAYLPLQEILQKLESILEEIRQHSPTPNRFYRACDSLDPF